MKERDCENCRNHSESGCSVWNCEFEPRMTEANIEAIKDFAKYVDLQPSFGVYDYFGNIVTVVDLVEDYAKVKGKENKQ